MFNLANNDLLSSIKDRLDKEQKELEKNQPKKKPIIKEKNLKKEDLNELKEHFLNVDEDVYDEEFERFKGQNEKDTKPIRVIEKELEEEPLKSDEVIKTKKGDLARLNGDDFGKYFNKE